MSGERRFFLLTYMVAVAIHVSLAFNIDTTNPDVYPGKQKDFFGYKVLQFRSGENKGILVTAPLQLNGSGGICKAAFDEPICFNPEGINHSDTTIPLKLFGLSIAENPTSSEFTVCSPSVVHECYGNSYMNSACFKMTDNLEKISSITPAFQNCTKKTVDLVFLFDGSRSMTEGEFNQNKDFIKDVMKSLSNTSIKFAAVQFSTEYRKVFDFRDYEAGLALDKLDNEPHMKTLTNTHKALTFVLEEILENPAAGASPDATKVLVVITDGDPSDSDRNNTIKSYDDKKIIRFVIGVKEAQMDKFRAIASEPKDKNAFKIENYDGLTGMLENFQKKIFTMEGSTTARAGHMANEMSQSGFSAAFHNDTLILGSVGSNSWLGSLHEIYGDPVTLKQIEDPLMKNDSYMGYSVSVGERNKAPLYFTGAPRSEHTGQVILFRRDNGKNWTVSQRINGDQIGSYFGAELCSVDVNSDGNTDFLLVGAPLFYQAQQKTEGQIYIFTLTDQMQLTSEANVTAPSMGRFGTTISSLADLNGDGLRDVAVGAPLEDDNRGAVYIYLGDRHIGIRKTFSQRIVGEKIKPGMRFFGQAIDGNIDLGEDGLTDIVIGSQGTVVVLRSRSVFNVVARLSFEPKKISIEKIDCVGSTDEYLPMVTITVCFEMVETTKRKAGVKSSALNISYTLDVDPMRHTHRGFFNQTKTRSRNFTSTHELAQDFCFNHTIYMPKCVKDTLSPIRINLNFTQRGAENASAVVSVDSKNQTFVEIPFEKQCSKNDTCIAELEVDFNFVSQTLLVREDNYFNLSITLSNRGDDSYNTTLTMHYPPGLSFSMMTLIKSTRPTLHICHDLEDVLDKTICGISLPVYRSKSDATFKTSFHVLNKYKWNDTMSVTVTGKSDNTNSNSTLSVTKSIPVQFEIKMALTVKEDTVTYLNFTTEDAGPKKIAIMYKIDNHGWKAFPVNVSVILPTRLEHDFEINNYQVIVKENKTQCTVTTDMTSEYCTQEKSCKVIKCDTFILDKTSATEFELLGDVEFSDLKKKETNMAFLKRYSGDGGGVKFKSFIRVNYDEYRYVLNSYRQQMSAHTGSWKDNDPTMKQAEVQIEFIIPPDKLLIILTGSVLGILLLIIITLIMFKLGCFKRKTADDFAEEEKAAALACASSEPPISQQETGSRSDHALEDKNLLNGGSTPSTDTEEELDESTKPAWLAEPHISDKPLFGDELHISDDALVCSPAEC